MIGIWVLALADLRLMLQVQSSDDWIAIRWVLVSPHFFGILGEGEWLAAPT